MNIDKYKFLLLLFVVGGFMFFSMILNGSSQQKAESSRSAYISSEIKRFYSFKSEDRAQIELIDQLQNVYSYESKNSSDRNRIYVNLPSGEIQAYINNDALYVVNALTKWPGWVGHPVGGYQHYESIMIEKNQSFQKNFVLDFTNEIISQNRNIFKEQSIQSYNKIVFVQGYFDEGEICADEIAKLFFACEDESILNYNDQISQVLYDSNTQKYIVTELTL